MRISWLEPDILRRTRAVLMAWHADAERHFSPAFRAPPPPPELPADRWPRIAEHVARAERVAQVVRECGVDAARERFQDSPHAIEVATLTAAAVQSESVDLELVVALFDTAIDDLVMYGPFLQVFERLADDPDAHRHITSAYEHFCDRALTMPDAQPMWQEWARSLPDGLAAWYVRSGRLDEADQIFQTRHAEMSGEIIAALAASRIFLAAGHTERATHWLARAADRADELEREDMARRLRAKCERILARSESP